MTAEELETENWQLRGDLMRYETSMGRAKEVIALMKHILSCHREAISWGVLDVDGDLKDRQIDPATRTRFEELDRVVSLADEFERTAPL